MSQNQIVLSQGAEAKLYIGEFNGEKCLVKERFQKNYRHPQLDRQLTKQRIRAECKAISRCSAAGILVPRILNMDLDNRKVYMQYFDKCITVKQYINDTLQRVGCKADWIENLGHEIGRIIGIMHENNIVHGDLTTSNMLIDHEADVLPVRLIFIDFGLSSYSQSTEDKGVDLYVLERALLSAHSTVTELFNVILEAYKKSNQKKWEAVIGSFDEIRARGRKRTMVG